MNGRLITLFPVGYALTSFEVVAIKAFTFSKVTLCHSMADSHLCHGRGSQSYTFLTF